MRSPPGSWATESFAIRADRTDALDRLREGRLTVAEIFDRSGPVEGLGLRLAQVLSIALTARVADQVLARAVAANAVTSWRPFVRIDEMRDVDRQVVLDAVAELYPPERAGGVVAADRRQAPRPRARPSVASVARPSEDDEPDEDYVEFEPSEFVAHTVFVDSVGQFADSVPMTAPDGSSVLVTLGRDGTLRVWDAGGTQIRPPVPAAPLPGPSGVPGAWLLALRSPDGPLVAIGCDDVIGYGGPRSPVRVFNPFTGELLSEFRTPSDGVVRVEPAATGDRDLLRVRANDGRRHRDGEPGRLVSPPVLGLVTIGDDLLALHPAEPDSYDDANDDEDDEDDEDDWPDETDAVAATASVWDPETGRRKGFLTVPAFAGMSGTGLRMLSVDTGAGTVLVAASSTRLAFHWVGTDDPGVAWEPGGTIVGVTVVRPGDGRVLLAVAGYEEGSVLRAVPAPVRCWDVRTGGVVELPFTVRAVGVVGIGDRLACVDEDGLLRYFDVCTGESDREPVDMWRRVSGYLSLIALRGPEGRTLFAGVDTDLRWVGIWDAATGEPFQIYPDGLWLPSAVTAVPRPDGTDALAVSDELAGVWLFDPLGGARIGSRMVGHALCWPEHGDGEEEPTEAVSMAVARRPDGTSALITGGRDRTIRRWDNAAEVQ